MYLVCVYLHVHIYLVCLVCLHMHVHAEYSEESHNANVLDKKTDDDLNAL